MRDPKLLVMSADSDVVGWDCKLRESVRERRKRSGLMNFLGVFRPRADFPVLVSGEDGASADDG